MRIKIIALLVLLAIAVAACGGTPAETGSGSPGEDQQGGSQQNQGQQGADAGTVTIWWNKGYYPEEDEALEQVVAEWEKQSGKQVDLSFYSTEDIPKKTQSAVESGSPPDIVFAHFADWQLIPRYAWEGKLADVSDVVEPVKDQYSEGALQAVNLQNNTSGKRAYYAVPLEQQTIHIFYWKDMLEQSGTGEIPTEWDAFWGYWAQCQQAMRDAGERTYAIGMPLSSGASDTYFVFEQVLEALDVTVLNENGELQVDDPAVKEGIAGALEFQAGFYKNDQVPKGAVTWQDPDNNLNFLNGTTCMTPNATLSIPAAKADDQDLYLNKIGTQEWPDEPDGEQIRYMASIKSAMVFENSPNKEAAKDFLSFLIKPENLGEYIKGSRARWFPVMPALLEDPFWQTQEDPHRQVAVAQFTERPTRPFPQVYNPAYSQVLAENVWGKALGRVASEGWTAEDAAEEAVTRIKAIFDGWK